MMKLFEQKSLPKTIAFWISCLFVYGGSVNYGAFDIFPAIPFIIFVLLTAFKWKKGYLMAVILLALICVPLHHLKKQHGDLFHPNLAREFSFNQDLCLNQHQYGNETYVLSSEITPNLPCHGEVLKTGTKLVIKKISVSNADLGESYVIHADTHLGELSLYGNKLTVWSDGTPVEQSDLRRTIFYVPSLLMYWPAMPILLLTMFNK